MYALRETTPRLLRNGSGVEPIVVQHGFSIALQSLYCLCNNASKQSVSNLFPTQRMREKKESVESELYIVKANERVVVSTGARLSSKENSASSS